MQSIPLPQQALPVLADVDLAVIGGSAAGVACGLQFAERGKRVMIVEPRTYLGREWTATLRPWIASDESGLGLAPEWVRAFADRHGSSIRSGRIHFLPDQLKLYLEDQLAARHIQLLYASLPVGLADLEDGRTGLVIANKSGRQAIACRSVLDATETAILSSLAGQPLDSFGEHREAIYYRTLEFTDAGPAEPSERADIRLEVPESLMVWEDSLSIIFGENRTYVRFGLKLPGSNTLEAHQEREAEARHRSIRLVEHLVQTVELFHKATLTASSHELDGPYAAEGAKQGEPDWQTIRMSDRLWCICRDVYQRCHTGWLDPIRAAAFGARLAAEMLEGSRFAEPEQIMGRMPETATAEDELAASYRIREGKLADEADLPSVSIPAMSVPVLDTVDVLVAGGGTSGAAAAIQSAGEGMRTMLLDMNPGLGGTGTLGGVDSYWFGRRIGYALRISEAVHDVQKRMRYKGHKWNIEAKMYALLNEAEQAGTDPLFEVLVFGAVIAGNQVRGAVFATRWGPRIALAECVIDATGDGDIAVYAGADFVYGSARDNTVMWYSLAQIKQNGKIQNNFTSMVDVSDIRDYTRAIQSGRRRGDELQDHGSYVATRESRHIVGEVTMKLTDQLLHRAWEDTINIHFSNHDVKGVSGADWIPVGLIPPNLEIEIPYRMLLPLGLEGILVVGKAVSATHDAFPAIRMQSDLENLGGAAALAAALAIKSGTTLGSIPVKQLQQRLVTDGLLSGDILTRTLKPLLYDEQQLAALADSIEADKPLYEYADMRMNEVFERPIPFVEIVSVGKRIIPFLKRALTAAEGLHRIHIAQALAMVESKEAVPVLIEAIVAQLLGEELPIRTAEIMYVQLPPDHGAMPDAAYLLYSLAQTRDPRSIPVWDRVVRLLARAEEDDFKETYKGLYYFVDAVCQGAERLGSPVAVPVLERLHANPLLHGLHAIHAVQPDYFLERRAMLELAIARALARSGSPKGYEIFIAYLTDGRSLLRKHALSELRKLTGQARGSRPEPWGAWLHDHRDQLHPIPYLERLDIETDSERLPRRRLT